MPNKKLLSLLLLGVAFHAGLRGGGGFSRESTDRPQIDKILLDESWKDVSNPWKYKDGSWKDKTNSSRFEHWLPSNYEHRPRKGGLDEPTQPKAGHLPVHRRPIQPARPVVLQKKEQEVDPSRDNKLAVVYFKPQPSRAGFLNLPRPEALPSVDGKKVVPQKIAPSVRSQEQSVIPYVQQPVAGNAVSQGAVSRLSSANDLIAAVSNLSQGKTYSWGGIEIMRLPEGKYQVDLPNNDRWYITQEQLEKKLKDFFEAQKAQQKGEQQVIADTQRKLLEGPQQAVVGEQAEASPFEFEDGLFGDLASEDVHPAYNNQADYYAALSETNNHPVVQAGEAVVLDEAETTAVDEVKPTAVVHTGSCTERKGKPVELDEKEKRFLGRLESKQAREAAKNEPEAAVVAEPPAPIAQPTSWWSRLTGGVTAAVTAVKDAVWGAEIAQPPVEEEELNASVKQDAVEELGKQANLITPPKAAIEQKEDTNQTEEPGLSLADYRLITSSSGMQPTEQQREAFEPVVSDRQLLVPVKPGAAVAATPLTSDIELDQHGVTYKLEAPGCDTVFISRDRLRNLVGQFHVERGYADATEESIQAALLDIVRRSQDAQPAPNQGTKLITWPEEAKPSDVAAAARPGRLASLWGRVVGAVQALKDVVWNAEVENPQKAPDIEEEDYSALATVRDVAHAVPGAARAAVDTARNAVWSENALVEPPVAGLPIYNEEKQPAQNGRSMVQRAVGGIRSGWNRINRNDELPMVEPQANQQAVVPQIVAPNHQAGGAVSLWTRLAAVAGAFKNAVWSQQNVAKPQDAPELEVSDNVELADIADSVRNAVWSEEEPPAPSEPALPVYNNEGEQPAQDQRVQERPGESRFRWLMRGLTDGWKRIANSDNSDQARQPQDEENEVPLVRNGSRGQPNNQDGPPAPNVQPVANPVVPHVVGNNGGVPANGNQDAPGANNNPGQVDPVAPSAVNNGGQIPANGNALGVGPLVPVGPVPGVDPVVPPVVPAQPGVAPAGVDPVGPQAQGPQPGNPGWFSGSGRYALWGAGAAAVVAGIWRLYQYLKQPLHEESPASVPSTPEGEVHPVDADLLPDLAQDIKNYEAIVALAHADLILIETVLRHAQDAVYHNNDVRVLAAQWAEIKPTLQLITKDECMAIEISINAKKPQDVVQYITNHLKPMLHAQADQANRCLQETKKLQRDAQQAGQKVQAQVADRTQVQEQAQQAAAEQKPLYLKLWDVLKSGVKKDTASVRSGVANKLRQAAALFGVKAAQQRQV